MDQETQLKSPNYKRIYQDIVSKKFPEKQSEMAAFFNNRRNLSNFDVININEKLFGSSQENFNSKLRVYTMEDIKEMLVQQKKYGFNNTEAALYFKVSRNSIMKWKKMA